MLFVVLLSVLVQSLTISAIEVTPPAKQWVVQDQKNVRLICKSDVKIRGCSFQTPYGTILSDVSDGVKFESRRLEHVTEEEGMDCGVSIASIEAKDAGEWKCIMSLRVDGESVSESGTVEVAFAKAPSSVVLDAPFNVASVNLTEGNKTDVKCVATNARAKPTFKWMIGDDDLEVEGKTKDAEDMIDETGISNFSQTLSYDPELSHNEKELKCAVQHMGLENEVIAKVKLIVPKPEEIEDASLSPGATVGIVIAVLILLSIVTTVFLIWRIKTSKEKDDEEAGTDAEKIALDGGMEQEEYEEDELKKVAAKAKDIQETKEKIAASKENVAAETPAAPEPTLIEKKEVAAAAPAVAEEVKKPEEKVEEPAKPAKEEPKVEAVVDDKGEKEKEKVEEASKEETKEKKDNDAS